MAAEISNVKLNMLRMMLEDHKIKTCLLMDGSFAKEIKVNKEGDVIIGRTKYGWINKLFNQQDKIDFFTLANKIAVIITGKDTIGGNPNDLREMVMEIVDKVMVSKDKEAIIEMLFFYVMFMCSDSSLKSSYINLGKASPISDGRKQREQYMAKGVMPAYVDLGGGAIPVEFVVEGPLYRK